MKQNIMALHFIAKLKLNADKDLQMAKTKSQPKVDKLGLARLQSLAMN